MIRPVHLTWNYCASTDWCGYWVHNWICSHDPVDFTNHDKLYIIQKPTHSQQSIETDQTFRAMCYDPCFMCFMQLSKICQTLLCSTRKLFFHLPVGIDRGCHESFLTCHEKDPGTADASLKGVCFKFPTSPSQASKSSSRVVSRLYLPSDSIPKIRLPHR